MAIAGDPDDDATRALLDVVAERHRPNTILALRPPDLDARTEGLRGEG